MNAHTSLRWAWRGALFCFILAGLTGALFRFGLVYGLPPGLQFANVRHAHSHLMYFGWVTPALMAGISLWLSRLTGRPPGRGLRWIIGATLGLGLLAYPPFLLYGYSLANLGTTRLPLSMIAAGLNGLAWYAFVAAYLRATLRAPRSPALRLWDLACGLLILSSLGGIGLMGLAFLQIRNPFWNDALVHLFLDLFADGWFVLALLGLLYAAHPQAWSRPARWGTALLVVGLPPTFLLALTTPDMPWTAWLWPSLGALAVSLGLALHIASLWPVVRPAWRVPLAFLALKAVGEAGWALPSLSTWAQGAGWRVPYLHWLLLGFVTLGLVQAMRDLWGAPTVRYAHWLTAGVLALQVSLIPLTSLWPLEWSGRWILDLAAWAALGPVIGAALLWTGGPPTPAPDPVAATDRPVGTRASRATGPAAPPIPRALVSLVALILLSLLAALWGGLIRLGWPWPIVSPTLIISHGALMLAGVLGTLISLERAVALKARWAFTPPILSGLGALAMILWATEGPGLALITLASLAFVGVFGYILRQHLAPYTLTMGLGAVAWAVGNLLWLLGQPLSVAVLWWVAFLVLTIAGERLELSRVLRLTPGRTAAFFASLVGLLVGLGLTSLDYGLGMRVTGLGLLALAVWLGVNDIARRTIRGQGLTRFIAACLLIGYVWLGVGGVLALAFGDARGDLAYDAILHSILLGFVFSMILGHAPIIAPALLRIAIPYDRSLYIPLVLLSLTLALRVLGDVLVLWEARRWGGLLNAVVLLLFMGNMARLAWRGRLRPSALTDAPQASDFSIPTRRGT